MGFRRIAPLSAYVRKFGRSSGRARVFPVRKRQLRARPASVPRFWRLTDDGRPPADRGTLELWALACEALRIPHRLAGRGEDERLYVPALYERRARRELTEMASEGTGRVFVPPPARDNVHWTLACLAVLLVWHGVTSGWWGSAGLSPEQWRRAGDLDVYRVRVLGEWYRCVTALTLHADSQHIFGNLLFGAPFLALLCRRVGLGVGLALALIGGSVGNALNALYRPLAYSSLGFSTALFATVGALSAILALDKLRGRHVLRRMGVVLAAGAGVLAMLGTGGERIDYAAHVLGLLAGLLTGGCAGLLMLLKGPPSRRLEIAAGCAVPALLALCWILALR